MQNSCEITSNLSLQHQETETFQATDETIKSWSYTTEAPISQFCFLQIQHHVSVSMECKMNGKD